MTATDQLALHQNTVLALRQARARIEALEGAGCEPLAVVGAACRLPGQANTPEAYWQLLCSGTDAVTEVPDDRWDITSLYDPDPQAPGKMTTRHGGFLRGVDQFDPRFFGISPREAVSMDPQQRLVLETGWEAIERAGIAADALAGSQTGVFIGASTYDYSLLALRSPDALHDTDLHRVTGCATNIIAGRLSYTLGLRGPSMVVDTACSSALVAVHLAARSLRNGECDLAITGGVSLMLAPELSIMFSKAHMLAADGRCKTFDAAADGFGRGEGCAIIVLRRLHDALAHGDPILALIRGSAVNSDGRSSGLTAPNGHAQQAVIRQALADARLNPADIGYVEAHGTGTALGDPIEIQALAAVLGEGRAPDDHLRVGAVKTNIGHLEAAAGIAGLLKTVLVLHHGQIPPSLHLHRPNPHIRLDELPVTVPTRLISWPANGRPRRAGVSSFGFSGTNAHVILEEAPPVPARDTTRERPLHLLCLSATSDTALRELATAYRQHLDDTPSVALGDVTHTANSGRTHFSHRAALVAASPDEMRRRLAALTESPASHATRTDRPPVAFLFTGQGAQYPGMGRRLYDTLPVFRTALDRCDDILRAHLDRPLLPVLYPEPGQPTPLDDTTYTQPALFAVEYALAQVWRSWGIVPSAVLGHSLGEYVAACVAGVLNLDDALALVAGRARLMGRLPRDGAMAAVFAPESQVAAAVAPHAKVLAIAAVNGPDHTVISGTTTAVAEATAALHACGIRTAPLTVSHAFHSPLMDPVLADLERLAAPMGFADPQIDLISNLTGQRLTSAQPFDGLYVRRHAREPVRFRDGLASLYELGYRVFVELGPRPVLLDLARRCLPADGGEWLPSLRRNRDDWHTMLGTLGALYTHGVAVDWKGFDRDFPCRRTVLPTYPFQRRRYWAGSPPTPAERAPALTGALTPTGTADPQPLATCLYRTEWRVQAAGTSGPPEPRAAGHWLILADTGGLGRHLADLLRQQGATADLIFAGDRSQDLEETLAALPPCRGVVQLWGLDARPAADSTATSLRQDQARHCASTLHIVNTLAAAGSPEPPHLWIVTRGAQPVRPAGDPIAVAQATLWGLGRVIALEHPQLWGGLIDLDPRPADAPTDDTATGTVVDDEAMRLLDDLCRSSPISLRPADRDDGEPPLRDSQIAWRDGRRHVARLIRVPDAFVQPTPIRRDAAYAITGGLGGLGSVVVRWLADQGARHIAVISRGASPDHPTLRDLEHGTGARVQAFRADVAQPDQLTRALHDIDATMPPLRGIVHAAGTLDDGLLNHQDWARFERVLAPKVYGAWNLHTLTQHLPLDFFVLFSSTASLLGSPGQANYAAANAFLDTLAHHRWVSGLPAVAVNWGPWDRLGMAGNVTTATRQRWAGHGLAPLAPDQATQALGALLNGHVPQVAVLRADWSRLTAAAAIDPSGTLRALLADQTTQPEQPGQQASAPQQHPAHPDRLEQLRSLDPHQRPDFIRAALRGFAADVLGMPTEDVPASQDLLELGMDSLMVVEVTRAIQQEFRLLLYPKELYEHPTIDALTAYLDTELARANPPAGGEPDPTARDTTARDAALRPGPVESTAGPDGRTVTHGHQRGVPSSSIPDIVFLLSSPRSGSTLLRVMLAGHPRLFCPPELHLLPYDTLDHHRRDLDRSYLHEGLQRALMELRGCDAADSKALLDDWIAEDLSIQDVYHRLRCMAAPRLLVDKSPTYTGNPDTLRRAETLFPDARYLCLVRHPYAAIESFARMRMHKLIGADTDDPFLVAEQVWTQTNQNLLHFLQQLDPGRGHLLRYEDLVHQPAETTAAICAFLGVCPDPAVLQPYAGARMTDGVHDRSRTIGDPNFLDHDHIDADLADAWKDITLPHPLGPDVRRLAARLGYPLPEPAGPAPAGGQPAVHQPDRPARPPDDTPAPAREVTVSARGLRLRVNAWGPPDGPVIVCLHGILDHGMAWEDVAAPLAARGYQVIAPDQRGHGCSEHAAAGAYQLLDYVADLDAVISGLDNQMPITQPVMLVGHSMGAAVAATFASLRPDRARGLVLVEGLVPGEPPEDDLARLLTSRLDYLVSTPTHPVLPDTTVAAQRLRQATPTLSADRAQRMAARITRPCGDGVRWSWDPALLTRADLTYDALSVTPARYRALLGRITAPVTLIYGRPDHPHLAQLRAALPHATPVVVPGGHNLHLEAPGALADAIARGAARAGVTPIPRPTGQPTTQGRRSA
jgi:acyl transferase domain-containing protein/alpha-beta hydrolase superfamily lysophospholipase/acyl carrier protein